MRWIVAVLLVAHGLIHLMGFAKAFGYADLSQLTQPISRVMGVLWLTSGLLVLISAALWLNRPRTFWIVGAVAVVLSQVVIVSSWRDAWGGTIMYAILLLLVTNGWLSEGPLSVSFVGNIPRRRDIFAPARSTHAESGPKQLWTGLCNLLRRARASAVAVWCIARVNQSRGAVV